MWVADFARVLNGKGARGARFFAETPFLGYVAWRKQAAFSIAVRDRLIRLAFLPLRGGTR